jgi:winged helix DNA-binding protein
MDNSDLLHLRSHNQKLSGTKFNAAHEVVRWLGAVQAQDYAGAKWALALRMKDTTDSMLDQALADGSILRTHLLRPTWHFVAPEDIRWLLKLTAPRVHAASAFMYRQSGLDKALFKKSNSILEKALRDGKQLTRTELAAYLAKAGIEADGVPLTYLVMYAELEGLICSGARRGKQFTYALLEERAPHVKDLTLDEGLAELTTRYFSTRGPATIQDYVWWSGLITAEARRGLEMVKAKFICEEINGQTYWFTDISLPRKTKTPSAYLLPNYDEYIVAYTERSALLNESHTIKVDARGNVLFQNTLMLDGQIVGTWKRTIQQNKVVVEILTFTTLSKSQQQATAESAEGYGKFLNLPIELKWIQ